MFISPTAQQSTDETSTVLVFMLCNEKGNVSSLHYREETGKEVREPDSLVSVESDLTLN